MITLALFLIAGFLYMTAKAIAVAGDGLMTKLDELRMALDAIHSAMMEGRCQ